MVHGWSKDGQKEGNRWVGPRKPYSRRATYLVSGFSSSLSLFPDFLVVLWLFFLFFSVP